MVLAKTQQIRLKKITKEHIVVFRHKGLPCGREENLTAYNLLNGMTKTIVFSEAKHRLDAHGNVIFERLDFSKNVTTQLRSVTT